MTRPGARDARYFRAKRDGYAARSVYKLEDIDRRYGLLQGSRRVLDLGCHPGSWLQYCAQKVGPGGRVLGVDLKPPTAGLPSWVDYLEADVLELTAAEVAEAMGGAQGAKGGRCLDALLSDLAPRTTGVVHADVAKSVELAARALELAEALLKPGGVLVAKVFQGAGVDQLIRRVKQAYKLGKAHKPAGSTKSSREIYLVGRGFKGGADKKS